MKIIAIIGASHSGVTCAEKLRHNGFQGRILLLDRMPTLPVQRPPLSKSFLHSKISGFDSYLLRSAEFYEKEKIELLIGNAVVGIDAHAKIIYLENGSELNYNIIILAAGADAKLPAYFADKASNMHVLRDTTDAESLKASMQQSQKAVIVGGGFIGLEVASSLRIAGLSVDIIEIAPRLLARVSTPQISDFFKSLHESKGVKVHLNKGLEEIIYSDSGLVKSVILSSGQRLECDLLIFGIGVSANTKLAKELGLTISDGVLVNSNYSAADDIYVIGDLAYCPDRASQRIESVYHAQLSAAVAAASITDSAMPKQETFWFWSDQYEIKLQIAELQPPLDEVALIHTERRQGKRQDSFSVWSWYDNKLVSVEAINDPQAFMIGKKLIEQSANPPHKLIADDSIALKQLLHSD
ncbi:MAG: FAD-dependent oxidoreductase [Alphaproteobacteria bacterium]|nr:FAD-dependent oxidoreductase [Alphaproteobacteria bacterium]